MISLLEHRADGDLDAALGATSFCDGSPVMRARIYTQYAASARIQNVLDQPRFYRADAGAVLSVEERVLTAHSSGFDPCELWEFARLTDCKCILCPGDAMGKLVMRAPVELRGTLTQRGIMRWPALRYDGPHLPDDPELWNPVKLDDVFRLLRVAFDNMHEVTWEDWYANITLRQRCGLAYFVALYDRLGICSTAAVAYSGPRDAVIGSVATRPDRRGQGLAGRLVRGLAGRILRDGKTPRIVSQTDAANRLYEGLGFRQDGEYCELAVSPLADDSGDANKS